jgi:ApaG protein
MYHKAMGHMTEFLPKYSETTRDIRVTVAPEYIAEASDEIASQYAFAYHVKIENLGAETVQLIERHWKIYSAGKQIGEVVGPGVVGHQPVLAEGGSFEYTSGSEIKDRDGYMEGTYSFQGQDGRLFFVVIPRFYLIYPTAIN